MANYNRVALMGNMTSDVELRHTPQGTSVGHFGLAVNRPTSGGNEETTFVDIEVWEKQAETCAEYLSKGRLIFLEGRLKQERWEKDGQKRSRLIVVAERVQFLPAGNGNDKSAKADPEGVEAPVEAGVPF